MTIRFSVAVIAVLLWVLIVSPACADTTMPVKPVEGRGIWVDANSIPTDDTAMAAFVESLAKANFNVLFPETMRRGYTIYPSKLDEQDPRFKGYDPLAAMIREAKKHGLEVHPWVWVFRQGYTNNPGPIFTKHEDWMAVNKWGETLSANGGYWISPSVPAARDYLISVFKEIVTNYDVDGLHLDYVRYENQFPAPYDYHPVARQKFKATHGVDPMDIEILTPMQATWHLWREDQVNTFVQRVSKEIRAAKPDIKISAAVGSMHDNARTSLLQNWPHWVDNKWVDLVTPMSYTANETTYRKMISSMKEAVELRTIIMPGLGLHTYKGSEPLIQQIEITRQMGTDGQTHFAAVYLDDQEKSALASGPYSNKAEIPFRRPQDRVKTLLDAAAATMDTKPEQARSYLRDASRLLGYLSYQAAKVGYVQPTPPPLVIPEVVLPIPSVDVPRMTIAPTIDGLPDESLWASAGVVRIAHNEMGEPAPVTSEVRVTYDDTNLYIAYLAAEPQMDKLKATVTKRDGAVFYDDSVELFIDPWNRRREYYQLSANTLGTQFDAKLNNAGINLEWKSAAAKDGKGWTAEIAIPYAALGVAAPRPGDKWAVNFARNRWVTGSVEYLAWSVTYGSFHSPERFGSITFK